MKKNKNQFSTLLAACDAAMARGFTHICQENETLWYFYGLTKGYAHCSFADKRWILGDTCDVITTSASAFTQTIEDWKADVLKPIKLDLNDI